MSIALVLEDVLSIHEGDSSEDHRRFSSEMVVVEVVWRAELLELTSSLCEKS